jgi:5-methylcytosine-specific restriction endonuclease McrA
MNARRRADPITQIYKSKRWTTITRPAVLERDGHRCLSCGATTRLEVAHIRSTHDLLEAGYDVFDPNLCHTLCKSCHSSTAPARRGPGVKL